MNNAVPTSPALPREHLAVSAATTWKLVWSDEFDYTGLPDPTKWGYEEGLVRNEEAQYYTQVRFENARVENSLLIIETHKEQFANARYLPGSANWTSQHPFAQYTSACLSTLGKAAWLYGRIDVRAKLPAGRGVWPAIWTLGNDFSDDPSLPHTHWPQCGEIDIMEYVGKEPESIHGTLHLQKNGKHHSIGQKLTQERPWEDFHVFSIDWSANRMDFLFDQKPYHSVPLAECDDSNGNAFRRPHFLMLNLALGGGWGGPIDDAILPQRFLIDYVRVYQQVPAVGTVQTFPAAASFKPRRKTPRA